MDEGNVLQSDKIKTPFLQTCENDIQKYLVLKLIFSVNCKSSVHSKVTEARLIN